MRVLERRYAEAVEACGKARPLLKEAGDRSGEVSVLLLAAQAARGGK